MPALSGLSSLIRMLLWENPPLVPRATGQVVSSASVVAKIVAAAECLASSREQKKHKRPLVT